MKVGLWTKSYSEYMNSVTKDKLFEGLIGYGLFSDKLPPIFTSEDFYNHHIKNQNNSIPCSSKGKDYVRYDNIKNINIPRQLAIPNPFVYAKLCKKLTENWENLQNYFKEKTNEHSHKVSRIHIRNLKNKKHLFEMNYNNFHHDGNPELDLFIGKKYLVTADISNCFPSIYSHTIPWAIKGKVESKKRNNHWSDKIDKAVRNLKYGETHGILVGPHASNIISEIILLAVDEKLYKKGYKHIRNIDDYDCYVESYDEAEKFLLDLFIELREYDLTINMKKTKILKLPHATTENWINRLNSYSFNDQDRKNRLKLPDLRQYWNLAIELFIENDENSAILNYAIKVISKKKLNSYAMVYHRQQIHHLVILYPYLTLLLDEYLFSAFNIDEDTIKDFANNIYENVKNKNLYEAMSYAIFFALKYKFNLKVNDIFKNAEKSKDTVLMLISYLYEKKHGKKVKLYKKLARELLKGDIDRHWLFIYEVLSKTELNGNKDENNCFVSIKKQGISFIKEDYK